MWKYAGISFMLLLLTMLFVGSAAAQGSVIPFTVIEIECSEETGEITEGEDVVHSQDQMDTAVWFSSEPLLNGRVANVLSWDYYPTPDIGLFAGASVYTPDAFSGTFENNFSGYWDSEGGNFAASGLGTGELAGMELWLTGGGISMESALQIVKDDPRVVDGNPCYPDPMPTHEELSILYGQIIDRRSPDQVSEDMVLQANEALGNRFMNELWIEGNLDVADEILADDFVSHAFPPGDREALKEAVTGYHEDHPQGSFLVHELIVTPDRIIIRGSATDLPEGAAAGAELEPFDDWIVVLNVMDGKIVERRIAFVPTE